MVKRFFLLGAMAAALAFPAQAIGNHESDVFVWNGYLHLQASGADGGKDTHIKYRQPSFQETLKGAEGAYIILESGLSAGNGCKNIGPDKVECLDVELPGVKAFLGDGADILSVNRGTEAVPKSERLFLYGEDGQDTLRGGNGGDYINGGEGNDSAIGGPGADRLGSLMSDNGSWWDTDKDRFRGGKGKDEILARDLSRDSLISCGPGNDKARRDKNIDPKPVSC